MGFSFEGLGPIPWVDLGGGAEAKIQPFRNMIMLHIKLIRERCMQQHGSKYFAHRHTLEVITFFFLESSHVVYQIKGNGA